MKPKYLSVAIAALLALGGWWLARLAWRAHAVQKSSLGVSIQTTHQPSSDPNDAASLPGASQTDPERGQNNRPKPGHMLSPPDPIRRFVDFTPEQRVEFARKGHGPGG